MWNFLHVPQFINETTKILRVLCPRTHVRGKPSPDNYYPRCLIKNKGPSPLAFPSLRWFRRKVVVIRINTVFFSLQ